MARYTKSGLAIELSRLNVFHQADVRLEQYPTDSEIAAEVLWFALMKGDIKGKTIADLGAGTGMLGIAALRLGAEKVYFVEKDIDAIKVLKENLADANNFVIVQSDVKDFEERVDIVVQNPPFGTRDKHIDLVFLKKAFTLAGVVYSMHKTSTKGYIMDFPKKMGFTVTDIIDFRFPLKKTQRYHKKQVHRIDVSCMRFEKNQ